MPGESRYDVLSDYVVDVYPARVYGWLYNVSDMFPALKLGHSDLVGVTSVQGVGLMFDNDDWPGVRDICDRIEDVPRLYERILTPIFAGENIEIATTYVAAAPFLTKDEMLIPSGDWLLRDEVSA
jgi:hypothetical protein